MENAKSQLVERLKTANSVLVTVSKDPTVDQLAACIGLTLLVNKLDKHGSAVFSGKVPSTIEFLKPEETLEKTPDSLRDFIIALDKNKADKLRYKAEDQMVKIFITPYRTSLSEKDFEFSQGDFNVELIIALGVEKQEELDEAIVAHGRILHDATVASINITGQSDIGTINWKDSTSSSLCELVTDLAVNMGDNLIDEQIATALLTGIIAETDRFSNDKTSSQTMSVSAKLMSSGANQQLVATNLNEVNKQSIGASEQKTPKNDDGTLNIKHEDTTEPSATLPPPTDSISDDGDTNVVPLNLDNIPFLDEDSNDSVQPSVPPRLVSQPPALGGMLTANSEPEHYDPSTDPLSNILTPPSDVAQAPGVPQPLTVPGPLTPQTSSFTPPPPSWTPPLPPTNSGPTPSAMATPPNRSMPLDQPPAGSPLPPTPTEPPKTNEDSEGSTVLDSSDAFDQNAGDQTLDEIEEAVHSPHVDETVVKDARDKVDAALAGSDSKQPDQALNAMPLGGPLHEPTPPPPATPIVQPLEPVIPQSTTAPTLPDIKNTTGLDPSLFSEPPDSGDQAPPVPPPITLPTDSTPKT